MLFSELPNFSEPNQEYIQLSKQVAMTNSTLKYYSYHNESNFNGIEKVLLRYRRLVW